MNGGTCTCSATMRDGQPMVYDTSRCPIHSSAGSRVTGMDADLAILHGAIGHLGHATTCALVMLNEECDCGHGRAFAALARVEAELSRLREERDATMRSYESCLGTLRKAVGAAEAAEARCARLQQALDQARACVIVDFYGGARSRAVQVIDEALAGADTPADSQETLTVWWWPKGLGVEYDIPVPYEQKLDAPSALAFAEQLSRVEGMKFVKVFGSSEHDIRWRYPADSQEDKT